MKRTVKVQPEDGSEQQMEDYLGLKWCEQTDAMGSTGATTWRRVAQLIREAILQGVSTPCAGPGCAQMVSRPTRAVDRHVEAFHQARSHDAWDYLILDGVWLKAPRPFRRF